MATPTAQKHPKSKRTATPATKVKRRARRRRRTPQIHNAKLELSINDEPAVTLAVAINHKVLDVELVNRFLNSFVRQFSSAMRTQGEVAPVGLNADFEEPGLDASEALGDAPRAAHAHNKALAHNRMRCEGLAYCFVCGSSLALS